MIDTVYDITHEPDINPVDNEYALEAYMNPKTRGEEALGLVIGALWKCGNCCEEEVMGGWLSSSQTVALRKRKSLGGS